MRYIAFSLPAVLVTWTDLARTRTEELLSKPSHQERSKFLEKKADWKTLKPSMLAASDSKCWYCEATSRRAPLDVDHFRPKLGTTVDGVRVAAHEGYYWLAYRWDNFRLACQRCNRPETDETNIVRGKRNEFPLRDEATRCSAPGQSDADEEPLFLDPCDPRDPDLLAYGLDGEVKPIAPKGTWDHERARYTIDRLGLNSFDVPRDRRRCWRNISLLIDVVELGVVPSEIKGRAKGKIKAYLSPDQEYLSFFRSVIGTHRDKRWIEDLLAPAAANDGDGATG